MIRYARERNLGTMISSNLNIAKDGFAEEVVESGLDYLEVSLDGADQQAYAEFRVGGDFEARQGEHRADRGEEAAAPPPRAAGGVEVHRDAAQRTPDRPCPKNGAGDRGGLPDLHPVGNIDPSRRDLLEKWVSTIPRYRQYDLEAGVDLRAERAKRVCPWLYRSASINCDGSVSPCCYYPNFPQAVFGDLRKERFGAIWNNDFYTSARAICTRARLAQIGERAGVCYLCRRSEGV